MLLPGVLLVVLGFVIYEPRLPHHLWYSGKVFPDFSHLSFFPPYTPGMDVKCKKKSCVSSHPCLVVRTSCGCCLYPRQGTNLCFRQLVRNVNFNWSVMTLLGFFSVLWGRLKSIRSPRDRGGHLRILGRLLHFCKGLLVFVCMSAMRLGSHYTKALGWVCYQTLVLPLAATSGRRLILVTPLSAGFTYCITTQEKEMKLLSYWINGIQKNDYLRILVGVWFNRSDQLFKVALQHFRFEVQLVEIHSFDFSATFLGVHLVLTS